MEKKESVRVLIEEHQIEKKTVFVAYSLDANVVTEGNSIEEVKENFREAMKLHLKHEPEIEKILIQKERNECPIMTRIFL